MGVLPLLIKLASIENPRVVNWTKIGLFKEQLQSLIIGLCSLDYFGISINHAYVRVLLFSLDCLNHHLSGGIQTRPSKFRPPRDYSYKGLAVLAESLKLELKQPLFTKNAQLYDKAVSFASATRGVETDGSDQELETNWGHQWRAHIERSKKYDKLARPFPKDANVFLDRPDGQMKAMEPDICRVQSSRFQTAKTKHIESDENDPLVAWRYENTISEQNRENPLLMLVNLSKSFKVRTELLDNARISLLEAIGDKMSEFFANIRSNVLDNWLDSPKEDSILIAAAKLWVMIGPTAFGYGSHLELLVLEVPIGVGRLDFHSPVAVRKVLKKLAKQAIEIKKIGEKKQITQFIKDQATREPPKTKEGVPAKQDFRFAESYFSRVLKMLSPSRNAQEIEAENTKQLTQAFKIWGDDHLLVAQAVNAVFVYQCCLGNMSLAFKWVYDAYCVVKDGSLKCFYSQIESTCLNDPLKWLIDGTPIEAIEPLARLLSQQLATASFSGVNKYGLTHTLIEFLINELKSRHFRFNSAAKPVIIETRLPHPSAIDFGHNVIGGVDIRENRSTNLRRRLPYATYSPRESNTSPKDRALGLQDRAVAAILTLLADLKNKIVVSEHNSLTNDGEKAKQLSQNLFLFATRLWRTEDTPDRPRLTAYTQESILRTLKGLLVSDGKLQSLRVDTHFAKQLSSFFLQVSAWSSYQWYKWVEPAIPNPPGGQSKPSSQSLQSEVFITRPASGVLTNECRTMMCEVLLLSIHSNDFEIDFIQDENREAILWFLLMNAREELRLLEHSQLRLTGVLIKKKELWSSIEVLLKQLRNQSQISFEWLNELKRLKASKIDSFNRAIESGYFPKAALTLEESHPLQSRRGKTEEDEVQTLSLSVIKAKFVTLFLNERLWIEPVFTPVIELLMHSPAWTRLLLAPGINLNNVQTMTIAARNQATIELCLAFLTQFFDKVNKLQADDPPAEIALFYAGKTRNHFLYLNLPEPQSVAKIERSISQSVSLNHNTGLFYISSPTLLRDLYFQSYLSVVNRAWLIKLVMTSTRSILPLMYTLQVALVLNTGHVNRSVSITTLSLVTAFLVALLTLTGYELVQRKCRRLSLVIYCLASNCLELALAFPLLALNEVADDAIGPASALVLHLIFHNDLLRLWRRTLFFLKSIFILFLVMLVRPSFLFWVASPAQQVNSEGVHNRGAVVAGAVRAGCLRTVCPNR